MGAMFVEFEILSVRIERDKERGRDSDAPIITSLS
jgi:hypothetical protein